MPPVSFGKKNLSILKPVEVLSSPLLMWLFQCVCVWKQQEIHMHTPGNYWTTLFVKQKKTLGRTVSKATRKMGGKNQFPLLHVSSSLNRSERSPGRGGDSQGWVETKAGMLHLGMATDRYHCWRTPRHCLVTCRNVPPGFSSLLNQFPIQHVVHLRNSKTVCAASVSYCQRKLKLCSCQSVLYPFLHVDFFFFWDIPPKKVQLK